MKRASLCTLVALLSFCAALGVSLALTASAETTETFASPESMVKLLFGIILAGVGGYAKGIERRVTDIEKGHSKTREELLGDYQTKKATDAHREEVRREFEKLNRSNNVLHKRLDAIYGPRNQDRNDNDEH